MTAMINFKELNQSLDPEKALLFIDAATQPVYKGSQIRAFCSIHKGDNQRSLAICPEKKTFKCHSCSESGDLIYLYAQSTGKTNQESAQELANYFQFNEGSTNNRIFQPSQPKQKIITKTAEQAWSEAKEHGSHSYLGKKGVKACSGLRYGQDQQKNHSIVVPYFDIETEQLHTVQYVHEAGKYFLTGPTTTTSIFRIGNLSTAKRIYVAEGLATILTIFQALSENPEYAFVSCASASNMADKVKLLRSKYQAAEIILCLDNDHTAQNIENALSSVSDIQFCKPNFTGIENIKELKKVKDFNDLHQLVSIDAVKEQIELDVESRIQMKQNHKTDIENQQNEEWDRLKSSSDFSEHCSDESDYFPVPHTEQLPKETVVPAEKTKFELIEKHATDKLLEKISLRIIKFEKGETTLAGISSGFSGLDDITDGFQDQSLIIIGARTGMGKTWFMLNLVIDIAIEQKIPVAIFSLEMSEEQIIERICSLLSKVPMKKMKSGDLATDEFQEIKNALQKIKDSMLTIKDETIFSTPSRCKEEIEKLHKEKGLKIAFIDHIGLMKDTAKKTENRSIDMGNITRTLKLLAKDLSVPIICLAQLNRMADNPERPQLSHLRESGSIEQDADLVMFLHREDYYRKDNSAPDNMLEVVVAKNRHGEQNKTIKFNKDDSWALKEENPSKGFETMEKKIKTSVHPKAKR